jgi:alpha-D-xyloside xylohydrolase
MKNYWFFLVAKALVQEGWNKSFNGTKRPFVWVRGMTAGAQRYATLWSGDIRCSFDEMKKQVRGLQLAGLSGFPFWGHDAGGFNPSNDPSAPGDTIYRQWSMAFGSFTPFWKPHGPGKSRWPADRGEEARSDALTYSTLRYELIPYIYTYAHKARETGMPIARAMVIDYPNEPMAWKNDLQYMWGDEFLVVPNCSAGNDVIAWIPPGNWYNYWSDELIKGGSTRSFKSPIGQLPLFVKAGSIVPMADYALSTAFIHADSLNIHVYPGRDAAFELYEDDGVSEKYFSGNEKMITKIYFRQSDFSLQIGPAAGNYLNAPLARRYRIEFHGVSKPFNVEVNGSRLPAISRQNIGSGVVWDEKKKILVVLLPKTTVGTKLIIKRRR